MNFRNELEIAISELQKRNEELENEIRYINYQGDTESVMCDVIKIRLKKEG